jgi:hypothetical protein
MGNVSKIESKHPYLKDLDSDGELWYDNILEDVIREYMCKLIKNEEL